MILFVGLLVGGCSGEESSEVEETPGAPPLPIELQELLDDTGAASGIEDELAVDAGTLHVELPEPPLVIPPIFPPADLPLETPDPDDEIRIAEGVLGVTGTETTPTAVLHLDEGGSLGLTGTPARELMQLSGARVHVEGRRAATPVGPGIEVGSYRLLEIEGRPAHVGILQQEPDGRWGLLRPDQEFLPLSGIPQDRMREGMKIWVMGDIDATQRFRVESYGIVSVGGP